jgi:putative transposase
VQRTTEFLAPLKKRGVSISMGGRGRALDNVFIERLWRSLKYELIYAGDFANGVELIAALDRYFRVAVSRCDALGSSA